MNEKNHKSSNGFLFGMILGGGLVFLLGTKKGRKILKELSEKGLDALENLSDLEYVTDDLEEELDSEGDGNLNGEAKSVESKPTMRRFFKGAKRRA